MVPIEPLGEANLGWLEGMTNGEREPRQLCPGPLLLPNACSIKCPAGGVPARGSRDCTLLGMHAVPQPFTAATVTDTGSAVARRVSTCRLCMRPSCLGCRGRC